MIVEYNTTHQIILDVESGYDLNNPIIAGSCGKSILEYDLSYLLDDGNPMLTNKHYKYFLRLNNRKKSHYVEEYIKHSYPIIKIPRDMVPIDQELIDWLNATVGEYAWTSDRYSHIALVSFDDATLFQLTFGGRILNDLAAYK